MKYSQQRSFRQNVRINFRRRIVRIVGSGGKQKIGVEQESQHVEIWNSKRGFLDEIAESELARHWLNRFPGEMLGSVIGSDEVQPHFAEQFGIPFESHSKRLKHTPE